MAVEHYETEEEYYAQFTEEKANAIRAFWAALSPEELENAKLGYLIMAHEQDIRDAKAHADKAVQLLDVAASYLEKREQMPFPLADHIAKAFRATLKAKANEKDGSFSVSESRRNTLAAMLNITAPGKRPVADERYLGNSIFRLMIDQAEKGEPISETAAAKDVAKEFNIKHRTAKDYWVKWKDNNPGSYQRLLEQVKYHVGG